MMEQTAPTTLHTPDAAITTAITEPVNDNSESVKIEEPVLISSYTADDVEKAKKATKRLTRTVVIYTEENEFLQPIIDRRIESGLSRDLNHFIRQCIDFAINSTHMKGTSFATGTNAPTFLKDAFFNPSK